MYSGNNYKPMKPFLLEHTDRLNSIEYYTYRYSVNLCFTLTQTFYLQDVGLLTL